MKTIILKSSNVVAGTNNSQYSYQFPNNPTFEEKDGWQIAVQSVAIYNSSNNIEAVRANNTYQITFNFATPVTLTVTMDDGYFDVVALNAFAQDAMVTAKYYVTNTSSQNVYFFEIVSNPVYYSIMVNLYPIPTAAQATTLGYTQPSGATWSYPGAAAVPQFVTNAGGFGDIIGFAKSTSFPTVTQTTQISYRSSVTPVLSPVNAYCFRCNMINSQYSNPTDIMYSLPIDVDFGSSITVKSGTLAYNDIAPNCYSNLVLTLVDQLMQPLRLKDSDISITFVLRRRGE